MTTTEILTMAIEVANAANRTREPVLMTISQVPLNGTSGFRVQVAPLVYTPGNEGIGFVEIIGEGPTLDVAADAMRERILHAANAVRERARLDAEIDAERVRVALSVTGRLS